MTMMDRMLQVEKENDRLRTELESRVPKLFMTPQSNYITYTDGQNLFWSLFGTRGLTRNVDGEVVSDIDDEHLNAKMFAGPVSVRINLGWRHEYVNIDPKNGLVTVKRFIEGVEQHIREIVSKEIIKSLVDNPVFLGVRAVADASYLGYEIMQNECLAEFVR